MQCKNRIISGAAVALLTIIVSGLNVGVVAADTPTPYPSPGAPATSTPWGLSPWATVNPINPMCTPVPQSTITPIWGSTIQPTQGNIITDCSWCLYAQGGYEQVAICAQACNSGTPVYYSTMIPDSTWMPGTTTPGTGGGDSCEYQVNESARIQCNSDHCTQIDNNHVRFVDSHGSGDGIGYSLLGGDERDVKVSVAVTEYLVNPNAWGRIYTNLSIAADIGSGYNGLLLENGPPCYDCSESGVYAGEFYFGGGGWFTFDQEAATGNDFDFSYTIDVYSDSWPGIECEGGSTATPTPTSGPCISGIPTPVNNPGSGDVIAWMNPIEIIEGACYTIIPPLDLTLPTGGDFEPGISIAGYAVCLNYINLEVAFMGLTFEWIITLAVFLGGVGLVYREIAS
jgi:hypothetical protein